MLGGVDIAAVENHRRLQQRAHFGKVRLTELVPLGSQDQTVGVLQDGVRVPVELDAVAQPGVRVRVRFAGRPLGGYLLERLPASDHAGSLAWLAGVVSPEPVRNAEFTSILSRVVPSAAEREQLLALAQATHAGAVGYVIAGAIAGATWTWDYT